jgi:CheY-like chemotaxis protein/HPt (histidine-containing phosphotransfer) domain-containing protein
MLMDGRIWVESRPHHGSTFHVTIAFPIDRQAGEQGHVKVSRADAPAFLAAPKRALRVLVAEDIPANQKLVLHILNRRGHGIVVAQNGQEALDLLQQQNFDAVLMDVQMPVMDGFQAAQTIRKLPQPRKAGIPIIAMTAHALKGDKHRCLAAGMDAYLSKPIKGEEMIELVERLAGEGLAVGDRVETKELGIRDWGLEEDKQAPTSISQSLIPSSQSPIPDPQSLIPVFDLDKAVSKCFGKYELFRAMVGCLFDEAGPLLDRMRTALATDDASELANAAHRLKGTVIYLSAPSVVDATKHVEQMGLSGDLSTATEAIDELERQLVMLQATLAPHRKEET